MFHSGPTNWSLFYENCGGKKQSPVDLTEFTDNTEDHWIKFENYGKNLSNVTMKNDGHTGNYFFSLLHSLYLQYTFVTFVSFQLWL